MRHLRSHADAFIQCGMRVNRLAGIDRIRAHFNRQRNDPCIEGDGFVGADLLPLSVRPMACSTSKGSPWFSGPSSLTMQPYHGVVTVSSTDVQTP